MAHSVDSLQIVSRIIESLRENESLPNMISWRPRLCSRHWSQGEKKNVWSSWESTGVLRHRSNMEAVVERDTLIGSTHHLPYSKSIAQPLSGINQFGLSYNRSRLSAFLGHDHVISALAPQQASQRGWWSRINIDRLSSIPVVYSADRQNTLVFYIGLFHASCTFFHAQMWYYSKFCCSLNFPRMV